MMSMECVTKSGRRLRLLQVLILASILTAAVSVQAEAAKAKRAKSVKAEVPASASEEAAEPAPSGDCARCHKTIMGRKFGHGPVGVGMCTICHSKEQPELCLSCHEAMRKTAENRKVPHAAIASGGCTSCHDPHSAPQRNLLQADVKGLCLKCHDKLAKQLKKDKLVHAAIGKAGCTGCHGPHTEDQAKLLKKPMKDLCAGCHKGKAAELKSQFLHGPVAQNECQGCHDPHSADHPNILSTFFPEKFYNKYKDGLYALCFNCHEKDIARDAKTTKLTDFRNGDENLHYVHVHSEKGRSCKACHQVHAGNQEKHIRAGVPFGSWMLPIKFKKTANGGTCNVGCHNPKSYNRAKAVKNP